MVTNGQMYGETTDVFIGRGVTARRLGATEIIKSEIAEIFQVSNKTRGTQRDDNARAPSYTGTKADVISRGRYLLIINRARLLSHGYIIASAADANVPKRKIITPKSSFDYGGV